MDPLESQYPATEKNPGAVRHPREAAAGQGSALDLDERDARAAGNGHQALPDRIRFEDLEVAPRPVPADRRSQGWLEDRVGVKAFNQKYGRKAFPVHTTFFLGEMALFSFVILVLTGIYLALIYTPSTAEVTINGETLPQAYASTQLIESIPVANLFRNVHHWCAHLMVISVLLHALRIFFQGTYRRPRELNWANGVALLALTLLAGFLGYALPFDSYAVTATGIGYGIARSVPGIGNVAAELFFGGAFPTLGSLPRLYTLHVFVVPLMLASIIGLHLLLIIKQKHSQPGYARKLAEPGRVLGVPLWPYQALLAGQLLLLMFGGLFLLSAAIPIHPLDAYGPPGPNASEVKPDWYLLWVYGFLRIIPGDLVFTVFGLNIGPEFLGGLVFPGVIFTLMALAPWLDKTNRPKHGHGRFYQYLEPSRQNPLRVAIGVGMLAYIGMLFVAAYYTELGFTIGQMWFLSLVIPFAIALLVYGRGRARLNSLPEEERFDPMGEDAPLSTTVGAD